MYIGLIDGELMRGSAKSSPSLELMKLAGYYSKKDFVEYIQDFDSLEKYDLLYYKKDTMGIYNMSLDTVGSEKTIPIGKGFTGSFLPMPVELDQGNLDKTYYQFYMKDHIKDFSSRRKRSWNRILFNEKVHLFRMTNGGILLPDFNRVNFSKKKIVLYDEELFLSPHAQEVVDLMRETDNKVYLMEVSLCPNLNLFKQIRELNFRPKDRNQIGVAYNGPLDKVTFLENWELFNNNYVMCFPVLDPSLDNFKEALVIQLIDYFNYVMYIYAKGGQSVALYQGPTTTIEQKMLYYFYTYSYAVGKGSEVDFLTYCEKSGKIKKETAEKFLKKYPFLKNLLSVTVKDVIKKGVWTF